MIQLTQELKEHGFGARLAVAQDMLDRFPNFNNIIFSDEAHCLRKPTKHSLLEQTKSEAKAPKTTA